jgi:hypothetical protein
MKIFLILAAFAVSVSSVAVAKTDMQTYNSLKAEESYVNVSDKNGNMLVGSSLTEKSDDSLLCQKRGAVVPNPTYSYECFSKLENVDAEKMYASLSVEEMYLSFRVDGSMVVGVGTKEKSILGLLCREYTVVVPDATPSYSCYGKY